MTSVVRLTPGTSSRARPDGAPGTGPPCSGAASPAARRRRPTASARADGGRRPGASSRREARPRRGSPRWTRAAPARSRRRPAARGEQVGQAHPRRPVAEAAEVDAGQDDLAVALAGPAGDIGEHIGGGPAAARPAHLRDHAVAACERAAVLHLDVGPRARERRLRAGASEVTHPPGDERRDRLGRAAQDGDVGRPRPRTPPRPGSRRSR